MNLIEKITNIEWAPLNTPLHRRLETLAAATWILTMLFGELICLLFFLALLYWGNIFIRTCCVIYTIFMYFDRDSGLYGGRGQGSEWVRNWIWWKYLQCYFQTKVHKTEDLPADRNYIFAAFPHGILSCATFSNFATNMTNTKKELPGIRTKVVSLDYHFKVPIFRELILGWGMGSVSGTGLHNVLTKSNDKNDPSNKDGYTSNAVVILIGGAQESLYCRPRNYQIVIKNRKGFIKLALKTGASIVPVIHFGEVEVYDAFYNPPGSRLRRYQEWLKSVTGIAPAKFIGRGFFQYSYGMFPRRKPLTSVLGAPINILKTLNPTQEDIDKLHEKFVTALNVLFETHKSEYITNSEDVHLIME